MAQVNVLLQDQNQPALDSPILPDHHTFIPPVLVAYCLVVRAERNAVQRYNGIPSNTKWAKEKTGDEILASRIIGFLFIELERLRRSLGYTPIARVMTEVLSNPSDETIYDLGRIYRDHFIRAFRTTTTRYPPPSNHPSRPSMDDLVDLLMDTIEGLGKDHRSARAAALSRDGYRCMLTQTYDESSCHKHPAVRKLADAAHATSADINACHIFNEPVLQNIELNQTSPYDPQRQHASAAIEILCTFGLDDLTDRLTTVGKPASASGVHILVNILSLNPILHAHFDALDLFLEPTADGEADKYDVHAAYPRIARQQGIPGQVKFVSLPRAAGLDPNGTTFPLPDPRLLALHAVCARVAHLSGAAEVLDKFDRDVEDVQVLAEDGSMAMFLDLVLGPYVGKYVPSSL
ncbi:hypothetical protein B0H14DRAFT_333427 [Mycena olivaceomarginata]|nr:hypothetical protein B0H14DRAFT_333427 [Mycena olivaceomarginata]